MSNESGRLEPKTELEYPDLKRWIKRAKVRNSKGNAKHKRIDMEYFDSFLVENNISVNEVDNFVLDDFIYYLVDDCGLAHSTVMGKFYNVRQYLNEYIDEDLGDLSEMDKNPFPYDYLTAWLDATSEKTKQNNEDIHFISLEDAKKLIEGAKNFKNEMVIRLLLNTGVRPSELSRMRLKRVNLKQRSIKVKSSKITDSNHELYDRTVFYSKNMAKYMDDWILRGGREAYFGASDSPYLIVGYNTPQIKARQINEIVKMAAAKSGIQETAIETANGNKVKKIGARLCRHTFAVHSVRGVSQTNTESIDVERLRRIMGHKTIESSRQYLRFSNVELKEAYDDCCPF